MKIKCAACGNELPTLEVRCTCSDEILRYCVNCLAAGVESYDRLVRQGYFSWEMCESYKNKILFPTLQYRQKTVEEFDEEVEKAHRDELEKLENEFKKLTNESYSSTEN